MKEFLQDRKKELFVVFGCTLLYLILFFIVENIHFDTYWYSETWIDQYIPFIDIFIIPYLLWFVYLVFGFVYFFAYDKKGFHRTCFYIFAGMYICILIYLLFPNAQGLRVELNMNNPLHKLIGLIYSADTATNVCPSIHVYDIVMMYISLLKNEKFNQSKVWKIGIGVLTVLICLSTVFTKQHAFIDGIFALPLCFGIYELEKII